MNRLRSVMWTHIAKKRSTMQGKTFTITACEDNPGLRRAGWHRRSGFRRLAGGPDVLVVSYFRNPAGGKTATITAAQVLMQTRCHD
ncbi:MAG: hypothetical protein Q8Q81_11225 [Oxalobacteraceae bacterium]|nr:hypothetical protein [Oxalobacteraceae bacterium]